MPRAIFTIPPAAAASRAGSTAMISALLAGVYSPRPAPSRPRSSAHARKAGEAGVGWVPGAASTVTQGASAAAQPAASAAPAAQRARLVHRGPRTRSATAAVRPKPAGSDVSRSPAARALPPRAVTACGMSTSGPNSTR